MRIYAEHQMNDHEQFSVLVIGNDLGLIEREEIIWLADQKILEQQKPPFWLIELSANGSSSEFLATKSDDVFRALLDIAYQKWKKGVLSDIEFRKCLRNIWNMAGDQSDWYTTLVWVEDELSLIEDGVFTREDRIEVICNKLEELIR